MKSRITIEVDFDNGQPYIKVLEDKTSDDVRDKLISFFRQRFGGDSSWCFIDFGQPAPDGFLRWTIHPITPEKLPEMISMAQSRLPKPSLTREQKIELLNS